jgi:hypothetical protein
MTVVVIAVVAGQPIITDDFWWHLKLGELLLENRAFPTTEPFLFDSVSGAPFLHEWLFEVVIASIEQVFGLGGLRLFHVTLALLSLLAVFRFSRRMDLAPTVALALVLIFFVFGFSRLVQLRPQLLSVPLFFWFLGMLYVHRSKLTKRPIALLAAATVFWANVHSIFVIVFPFWAALVLSHFLVGANKPDTGGINVRSHLAGMTLCLAAALVNPRGWGIFTYYFQHNQVNPAQDIIDNFGRFIPWREAAFLPLSSPLLRVCFVLLVIAVLVSAVRVIVDWRFRRPESGFEQNQLAVRLYLAAAAVLSMTAMFLAVRFTWLVPLAAVFIVLEVAGSDTVNARMKQWIGLMVCLVSWAFVMHPAARFYTFFLFHEPAVWANYWETNYDEHKFRKSAVDFLEHVDTGGNLYNPYHLGGYLAWRLSPRYKTFLDGRHDRYSAELYADSNIIRKGTAGLLQAIERYPFDAFLVPADRNSIRLRLALAELDWTKVFHNRQTTVFVRPAFFNSATTLEAMRSWHAQLDLGETYGPDTFQNKLDAWIVANGFAPLPEPGSAPMQQEAWEAEFVRATEHLLFDHAEILARYARATWVTPPRVLEDFTELETIRVQLKAEHDEISNTLSLDQATGER